MLATKDGRIVLENTLDARLEVVFKQQLPEVCQDSSFIDLVLPMNSSV